MDQRKFKYCPMCGKPGLQKTSKLGLLVCTECESSWLILLNPLLQEGEWPKEEELQ